MELVRILHVVDTLSSSKHEFNHIYTVGFGIVHFDAF